MDSKTQDTHLDALVIGANIRGLVSAYTLASLGYRVAVVERSPRVGGADGTFKTSRGTQFEFGMHVLDFMRSELATRLFTHAVDGRVHRTALRRGMVIRGHVMPYAPEPREMPRELTAMLPSGELVDELGDAPPTRENLSAYYGRDFTNLMFDEVLPSFPTENRHRAFGVAESLLLANVYPWFFPRAKRKSKTGDASRAFHDLLRSGTPQEILYPREGGFGGFAAGFVEKLRGMNVEILTGANDLSLDVETEARRVRSASALGRQFRARHYFWATSWDGLCKVFGIPCQEVATDRVLIGSFRFDRPLDVPYNELLVGDPNIRINRAYFPSRFRESDEPLLQVEFAVPKAEDWSVDSGFWRDTWLDGARRIGLIDGGHAVEEYDFKSVTMHFNGFGMEGVPLVDADPRYFEGSNVHPVAPSMANLNLNTHVPRTVREVTAVISSDSAA
jgi:glycine/D-amino acid oxidase-like deaminating enzyme